MQELGGGRGAQQPPAVEHDDVVTHPLELPEQVGGDEHGDAELVADPLHQPEHVVARGGVQPVGGLVEQHQPRVVDQRLGELGPLLHAGGVAADRAVALLGQPHVAQHVGGALAGRGERQARHLAQVHDQVAGRHVGRQAVVLGHVADQGADRAAVGGDVVAEHARAAAGRRHQAEQDLDQGGLAGAVRPDQAGHALADGHVEAVQRRDARVLLGEPRGVDDGHNANLAPSGPGAAGVPHSSGEPPGEP